MEATARKPDINGWYEIQNNPLSQVGVYEYLGSSIDRDGSLGLDPNEIYNVYRPESELSDPECIESFKLLPWINDHEMLGGTMTPAEQKGIEGVIGQDVYYDETDGQLKGNIKIFSENMKSSIDFGKEELSCGYRCKYELKSGNYLGKGYSIVQRAIRGNHLALVDEGRMGKEVSVLNSARFNFTFDGKEAIKMPGTHQEDAEETEKKAEDMQEDESKEADQCDGEEEDKEEEDGESPAADMSIEELAEMVKGIMPAIAKINDMMDTMNGNGGDEKKEEDGYDMDAVAKENQTLKRKISKMDKSIKSIAEDATRKVLDEIKGRDVLAQKLSFLVGTFDASDMTKKDVERYGVKKLGISCNEGSEGAALAGYMHAKSNMNSKSSYSLDSKKKSSAIDKYLQGDR